MTDKAHLTKDEEVENPGECQCCGFQTKKLQLFKQLDTTLGGGGKVIHEDFWFCALCVSTLANNAYRYPGQYQDGGSMRTICYVGNALLEALRKR